MALVVKDRVKVRSTTTGTGTLTLGTAFAGFQTFNNALADGDTTYYGIFESSTGEFEVGIGTFTSSGNTLSRDTVLESSNTGAKVNLTADTEVFITYPAEKSAYFDASGDLVLNQDPTSNLQAATKQYVDTIAAAGLHYHAPVRVQTTANLTATYNNGSSGVGATLTNSGTQAAISIDNVTLSSTDRVLVSEQTNAAHNGVYTVTNVGSASTNWVLTRATDADSYGPSDPDSLGEGDAFFIKEGDTNAGHLDVMTTSGTITFGTTDIVFSEVAETTVYSAGNGLSLSGTEFTVGQGTGITVSATTVSTVQDIATTATPQFDGLTTTGNITFGENDKAIFGAGSDLQIYHNGSNSVIWDNGTGNLRLVSSGASVDIIKAGGENMATFATDGAATLYYDNSAKIATSSSGISVTGNATFADNGKAIFGAGSDLQIYHDGSNSYIDDAGTGNLTIRANQINFDKYTGEAMARFRADGNTELFYDNASKLATTSTGVDITGTLTSDGLTVDGDITLQKNNPVITIADTGTTNQQSFIRQLSGTLYFDVQSGATADGSFLFRGYDGSTNKMLISYNGDISFYEDTGTTAKFFWDASAESLGIGTSSPSYKTEISDGTVTFGVNPLSAYSTAYVGTTSNHNMNFITNGNSRLNITSGGNVGIGTSSPTAKINVVGSASDNGISIKSGGNGGVDPFKVTWSGGTEGDMFIVDDSGNVGIGTTSPAAELDVQGAAAGSGTAETVFRLSQPANTLGAHNEIRSGVTSGTDPYLAFAVREGASPFNTVERMRIDSSGKVGIGTSSPSSYHANADNLVIQDSGNAGITIATTDSAYFSQINFADGTSGAQAYTGILRYAHSDNSLRIIVNAGEKMRISSGGVLSVGNTAPKTWHSNSAGVIQFGGVGALENYNTTDDVVTLSANVYRASDGTFKYMETNEATRFYQYAGDMAFQTASSGTANTAVTLNTRLFIKNDGNIGINTASPSSTLDVNGNITADNIHVATYIYHEGDTDTSIAFDADTITLVAGGSSEVTVNTTGVRLGDTGNGYFQPVSGNYGSIQIDGGAHGGYEGYNIGGRVAFLHNNGTESGISDDVNNAWMVRLVHGGAVELMHNASKKLETTSSGIEVTGGLVLSGDIDVGAQTGTWITSDEMSDSIGWNTTHGTYIGSDVSGSNEYIYGDGTFYDGSAYRNLWHDGNTDTVLTNRGTGTDITNNNWNDYIDGTEASWVRVVNMTGSNRPPNYHYGTALNFSYASSGKFQLYASHTGSAGNGLYFRTGWGTDYKGWAKIYDSVAHPALSYVDVATGNYGTIKVDDDRGTGWAGYAIQDDWVFMGRADDCGIYNDTDNEWVLYAIRNGSTYLYHNGTYTLNTVSGGVAVTGALTATGDITAYYSDERLKNFEGKIDGALDKVSQLNGYYFRENDKAKELGFENDDRQVGVSAQEVEAVLPEVIKPAPVDPEYKTVQYEKLVPLLIEAIKELKEEVRQLKESKA